MSLNKRIRCLCGHYDSKHYPKRGKVPAYCTACRGAKAMHEVKLAVTA